MLLCYASLGLGNKYQPVPPLCLSKLYWSIAIPQMTYGLELVYLSRRDEKMLESTHSSMARIVQGLPKQTSGPAVLLSLGPCNAIIAYKRILCLWRILVKHMGSVDKVITVHGILEAVNKGIGTIHPGPLRAALESLIEYHLLGIVSNSVKMGTY